MGSLAYDGRDCRNRGSVVSRLPAVFASLLIAACAPPVAVCGPSTCAGCCDANGECVIAPSALQCGASGSTCSQCVLGQTCSSGFCTNASSGGGTATGGGNTGDGNTGGGNTGGGNTGGGNTGGGNTGGGNAGGGNAGGGNAGGGNVGGGSGTGGGNTNYARVYLADFHDGRSVVAAQAAFFPNFPATRSTIGPCKVMTYDFGALGPLPNAGDVTFTVTGRSTPIVLRAPTDGGFYAPYSGVGEHVFNGGETVVVTAAGGSIPAFSANLIAPTRPTVLSTGVPDGGLVDRNQHLTVTWSGATNSEVIVSVIGSNIGGGITTIDCTYPGSVGSGTVLSSVLQLLPVGSTCIFGIGVITSRPTTAGTWTFDVDAIDYVVNQSIINR